MAYTNRNFTWDFDALKRFYERYIIKWINGAVSWTDAQKKQARANLGFGDGDGIVTTGNSTGSDLDIADDSGNVLARLADGHIKTKNFDSSNIEVDVVTGDTEVADLDFRDESGNVLARLANGHIMTKNFNSSIMNVPKIFNPKAEITKSALKILDIGNSFTKDATHYLPNIITNKNIPNTFSLYYMTRGSGSFSTWVNCFNDIDNKTYASVICAGQSITDVPVGTGAALDGSLFRNVLNAVDWDIIIIHQVSTYSSNYELWEDETVAGHLKEFIRILKQTNPQAEIGFYLVHSTPSNSVYNPEHSSNERWKKIAKATKSMMTNYGINFIVPYGTAIQNIRQCSIVDNNELSNDGKHNADGLADYTASCCYFQQLFGARNGISVIGDTFRVNVDATVNGQISVTDSTALLAQKAAILACCDAFTIQNPDLIQL